MAAQSLSHHDSSSNICYCWTGHSYSTYHIDQHCRITLNLVHYPSIKWLFDAWWWVKSCNYIITIHQGTGLVFYRTMSEVLCKLKDWQTESDSKASKVEQQCGRRDAKRGSNRPAILPFSSVILATAHALSGASSRGLLQLHNVCIERQGEGRAPSYATWGVY